MDSWENGANGGYVKSVIDKNFSILEERVNKISSPYVYDFKASNWSCGAIDINYSNYNKTNPCVEVYMKTQDGYISVLCGYKITDDGIQLLSDLAYEGRVVIK